MHKNQNKALGNYCIYEIVVNGVTYKIGKADLDRITLASGDPTRIHQQVVKLRKKYGRRSVAHYLLEELFGVTTQYAKDMERAFLKLIYQELAYVPEGNKKSFKPDK